MVIAASSPTLGLVSSCFDTLNYPPETSQFQNQAQSYANAIAIVHDLDELHDSADIQSTSIVEYEDSKRSEQGRSRASHTPGVIASSLGCSCKLKLLHLQYDWFLDTLDYPHNEISQFHPRAQ